MERTRMSVIKRYKLMTLYMLAYMLVGLTWRKNTIFPSNFQCKTALQMPRKYILCFAKINVLESYSSVVHVKKILLFSRKDAMR